MAKKRSPKKHDDWNESATRKAERKAAKARAELVNAYYYMMGYDNSPEMRRNFRIVDNKVDRTWQEYQDMLVYDQKINRRTP
jgi:hypothetical protein